MSSSAPATPPSTPGQSTAPSPSSGNGLRRSLKARHLSMIAIGGSIGTGLFVASGATISQAGPGGALLAYGLIGLMVYFLMTSLGELAAYMPVSGSFATYGARYVDEGFGFALGWNYWYNWAITIAVDLVAAQLVMGYWMPEVPGVLWSALFLGIMFLLNVISVKGFGEAEYWFAAIKVITVIIFIAVGLLMIVGILHGSERAHTFSEHLANWSVGEAPFAGGFAALIGVAMIVGFSFQGTELIGIAAGESADPGRNIPRAVRQVFWRILLFYILAILVISLLIPYTDPRLLRNEVGDVSVSPFTLVFERAGLLSAAALMNAVVLTSVLSAGNSGMYASTRMLYTLACRGMAPRVFARVSTRGVPVYALLATTVVAALCFATYLASAEVIYIWLLNLSGMTGFIAWLGIAISHYRFRRAWVAQGRPLSGLRYRAKWFPFGPLLALALCVLVIIGQDTKLILDGDFDWERLLVTYMGLPVFFGFLVYHKLRYRTRLIALKEVDLSKTDRD